MEWLQLQYFLVVAKHQHITNASRELNVSQPTISQSVKRLEDELGVPLFDRVGRSIVLNDYGKVLYKYATEASKLIDTAIFEIGSVKDAQSNSLTISYWTSSTMIPELLSAFTARYPYVKIRTVNPSCEHDFSFSFSAYSPPPFPCEIILQEEIFIAIPLSNPLSARSSLDLAELKDEDFICVTEHLPFRKMTDDFCRLAGFKPRIVLENEHYRTLEHLLNLGAGISFWPEKSWHSYATERAYKLVHIKSPMCMRAIYLSWPENYVFNNTALLFKNFVKSYFTGISPT